MSGTGFHQRAWLVWLAAAAATVTAVSNPFAAAAALAALGVVAASFGSAGPEGRGFAAILKLGALFLTLRVVLFGLSGHTGATTLFRLPEVSLPRWLGGLELGGRVTGEVVAQSAAEGLRLAAFLACFGAFVAVTDVYRVLRMLPRFLAEAGLVATIALTMAPTMLRVAADVRDAQRLRGHRIRGPRSALPLVAPIVAGALERSVTLAESMEARGHGRREEGAHRAEAIARATVLAAMVALAVGGALVLYERGPAPARWLLVGAAGAGLAAGLSTLSRLVPRTRFRPDPMDRWDLALVLGSAGLAAGAALAARLPASSWYPYPAASWPDLDARLVVLGVGLALPVGLGALRRVRLARASRRAPAVPEPEPALR